jgi:hypothetical protein
MIEMMVLIELVYGLRDTLKPNLEGNSANSLSRRVPLPTPDGPERTMGARKDMSFVTWSQPL